MELEEIRNKYQCDEGRTFAQWKEWVRKTKPSQAQAHIVKAVAPNGSKYEMLIGGYTDAQNTAFDLVSHGYKDVKLYHSVNAGPLNLLRNFSAPLHGAKFKDSVDFSQDKLLITANGFGNEKGVFKKDPRNGLKPFEVNFYIKGKDGKLFKTGRSKMAASLNEAKQWANSESRKYKNVAKVEVKEFRDSVDSADSVDSIREKYAMDAAMGIKISGNEKGTERLTMEKVFKEWISPAAAWQKVKKGNTIMIRFNGSGPNKKLKGKDVLKIEYFNPNVVAMTPRFGGTQLVGFPRINVMVGKLASEGLRSYPEFENMLLKKDSADFTDAEDKKNDITRAYPYQDILNRFMTLTFGRPRKTQAMPEEKSEVKRAYDLFKKNAGNSKFANEWLPKYKRFFKKFGIILDSTDDFASDAMDRIRAKYCMDGLGYNFYDLKTALANGDIKPNQRMVSSVGGGMAKTAKEWLDMGVKVVNANKPYALNKIKTR